MPLGARFLIELRSGVKKYNESSLLYEFLKNEIATDSETITLVIQQAFLLTPHPIDRTDFFQNRRR